MLRNRKERSAHLAHLYEDFRRAEADLPQWHLRVDRGQQGWHFSEEAQPTPKHTLIGQHHLGEAETLWSPPPSSSAAAAAAAAPDTLTKAVHYFAALQTEDGHWAGA